MPSSRLAAVFSRDDGIAPTGVIKNDIGCYF
jgi:hypothetical protein